MQDDVEMVRETFSFCRRCASRVEIGRVPIGANLTCTACGFVFPASGPLPSTNVQGGGVAEKPERLWSFVRWPSLRTFFSRTFSFPIYRGTLYHTLMLAMGTIAVVGAVRLAAWCINADDERVDKFTRVLLWNGLLLSASFGTLVTLAWTFVASAYGLTILRDTSEGCDAVVDWPNVLALEGLGESMYVVVGLLLCMLPGLLAHTWWHLLDIPGPLLIFGGVPLFFPLFLLSMLANNSPVNPVSLPVWRSLLWAWHAWVLFYALTATMAAIAIATTATALYYTSWMTGVVVTGVAITAAWMIYFRLLGRLACFCSGRSTDNSQRKKPPTVVRRRSARMRGPSVSGRRRS